MRVFCDTNILIEYLFKRKEGENVKEVFRILSRQKAEKVISAGGFYTLTYLIEVYLKRSGLRKEERIVELRRILSGLLAEYTVQGEINWEAGLKDYRFDDLEDSYQYQSALSTKCDILLTLNEKDFRKADSGALRIYTPSDFLETYRLQKM